MSVQRSVRSVTRVGAAVLAAGLIAGACGSSGKTTSSGASSTTTGSASTAAASGGSGKAGLTASTITIGQIATETGPVPGLFQNAADSMDAFVAYINSQGGVDGRKLKLIHKDDALDCNTYTSELKTLSTEVFAVVGSFSVEDECGAGVLKADPTFPDVQAGILNPEMYSVPNAFTAEPQPPGGATTGYLWVKNKYPNDITKVGTLYPTAAEFDAKEQQVTAESLGYKYIYQRGLGNFETTFTSDILRMKADGVKIVDMGSVDVQDAATFEQEAAQQGFHPDALISAPAYDSHFFSLVGSASDASNLVMPLLYPLYLGQDKASNPALATYLTWLDKVHPGDSASIYGVDAWSAGQYFVQALKAAGSSPTQASLLQALDGVTTFNADGMMPTTDPAQRKGATCMVIAGVVNGQFARLDPTGSGYDCNGSYYNAPLSALG